MTGMCFCPPPTYLIPWPPSDKFERSLAVRYLGGILQLPTFWNEQPGSNHQLVLGKIFKRVVELTEDANITSDLAMNPSWNEARADMRGLDIIASAVLNGAQCWHPQVVYSFPEQLLSAYKRLVEFLH